MQAIALFMAGYSQGEIIACFRDAFHRYDSLAGRGGDNIRRYATRSQLLLAEYCCKQSHYSEANAALMRAQSQVKYLSGSEHSMHIHVWGLKKHFLDMHLTQYAIMIKM